MKNKKDILKLINNFSNHAKKIEVSAPDIDINDIYNVVDCMVRGWHGDDKYYFVEKFEKDFAKYCNRKYCVAGINCTTSIELLLACLDIKQHDEIIINDLAWQASIEGAIHLGAKPVFCDVNKKTWCLDEEKIIEYITPKTKAIISVNLYGNMPNYDLLHKICHKYNLFLIEDFAESLGSKFLNKNSGSFGHASVCSFHRTKTLTTGEGGVVVTDDDNLYHKMMWMRDHCRDASKGYYNTDIGYKFMPFNLQMALGCSQLNKITELINKKRHILHIYQQYLKNFGNLNIDDNSIYNGAWITAFIPYQSNYTKLVKQISKDIPIRRFFYPMSSMKSFEKYNNKYKNINTNSYQLHERGILLPSALNLTDNQVKYCAQSILSIL